LLGNPTLKSIITDAWFSLSEIVNTSNSILQYMSEFSINLCRGFEISLRTTLNILEQYHGPLMPTLQDPEITFSLPSPDVVLMDFKTITRVLVLFYAPSPPNTEEEFIVLSKIIGHELFHMYLDLEFLQRNFPRGDPGIFVVEPIKDDLVMIEESVAEAISNIVSQRMLSENIKPSTDFLKSFEYTNSYNSHLIEKISKLKKVPSNVLSSLINNRRVTKVEFKPEWFELFESNEKQQC
ncbi:hypothetical protein, partial [Thermococcus sp. MV5]